MMGDVSQSGHSLGAPGVHPDADQLSAFVEHALPAHERNDVLAHLAGCRDCRETVAMALPPVEVFERTAVAAAAVMAAAPVRVAAPRRRAWFTRWTVLLPAAAAVAALGLFVAYVSRVPNHKTVEQTLPEQAQNAGAHAPTLEQRPLPTPAMAPVVAPTINEVQKNGPEASSEKKSAGAKGLALSENAGTKQSESEADRMSIAAQPPEPTPAARANDQLQAHPLTGVAPGVASGSAGGMLPQTGRQQAPQQEQPQQQAQAQRQSVQQGENTPAAGYALAQAPAQAAPNPAPPPPPAATQTVNVASATAAPIETMSTDITREVIAPRAIHGTILQPSLPSRLSVLSTAAFGSRVLAIDAHNAVFLSTDSGAHWKRIKGRWQGQAVRVNLLVAGGSALSVGGVPRGNLAGFEAGNGPLANTGNASLTGTVTDRSGAAIPRATVVVTDAATGTTRTVTTDADGRFAVGGLASGSYEVEATAAGFAPLHLAGVAVDASHANVASLTLEVGASAETVTVTAAGTDMKTGAPAAKKAAAPTLQPPALFEITTDTGERWTSADGKTWNKD